MAGKTSPVHLQTWWGSKRGMADLCILIDVIELWMMSLKDPALWYALGV